MAVELSPWPTDAAALDAARDYLRAQVAGRTDDDAALDALAEAGAALVERHAPGAPAAVRSEALVRIVGYLAGSDYGAIVKESIGPQDFELTVNHSSCFRNCGAAALLSPWRVRRARAI